MKLKSKVLVLLLIPALAGCGTENHEVAKSTTPPEPSSVERTAEPEPEVTEVPESEVSEFDERSAYWTERIQDVYTYVGRAVTMDAGGGYTTTFLLLEGDAFIRITNEGNSVDLFGHDGVAYFRESNSDIWYVLDSRERENIYDSFQSTAERLQTLTMDADAIVTVVGHDDANNWDICDVDGGTITIDCNTELMVSVQVGDVLTVLTDIGDVVTDVDISNAVTLSADEYADKCAEVLGFLPSGDDSSSDETNYWTEHKDTLLPEDNFTIHSTTSTYSMDVTTFEGNIYTRYTADDGAIDIAQVDGQTYVKAVDDFNWYKYDESVPEFDLYIEDMRKSVIDGGEIVFVEHDDTRNYDICGNGGAVVTIDCATGHLVSVEDVSNSFIFEEADRLCEYDDFSRAMPLTDENLVELAVKLSKYLGGGL